MPFNSRSRGDARDAAAGAPYLDGGLAPEAERSIQGTAVGALVVGGLPVGMTLAGFAPAQTNDANAALGAAIDKAMASAAAGADGAVTLRFEAGRDGSRRVRIGVTAGGRPIAEPLVFEAPAPGAEA